MKIVFIVAYFITLIISSQGQYDPSYPYSALQCMSSLTLPDRKVICPEARWTILLLYNNLLNITNLNPSYYLT